MSREVYPVAVIGGGHAGIEAAWISSQFKLSVALVSFSGVGLGSMPCNPAIGGVGMDKLSERLMPWVV